MKVESLADSGKIPAGEAVPLRFLVTNPRTDEPRAGLKDLGVLTFNSRGWQKRQWARAVGDGIYEITFTPPKPGAYFVSFQCPSLKVRLNQLPPLILHATEEG